VLGGEAAFAGGGRGEATVARGLASRVSGGAYNGAVKWRGGSRAGNHLENYGEITI
jgi:hypothetical protein